MIFETTSMEQEEFILKLRRNSYKEITLENLQIDGLNPKGKSAYIKTQEFEFSDSVKGYYILKIRNYSGMDYQLAYFDSINNKFVVFESST